MWLGYFPCSCFPAHDTCLARSTSKRLPSLAHIEGFLKSPSRNRQASRCCSHLSIFLVHCITPARNGNPPQSHGSSSASTQVVVKSRKTHKGDQFFRRLFSTVRRCRSTNRFGDLLTYNR